MSNTVYLSIGSNLGNRQQTIEKALQLLQQRVGSITKSSSLYETSPWGFLSSNMFVNIVVALTTNLSPETILSTIHIIESSLGREYNTNESYVSRTIDIDIIYYNTLILNTDNLIIPHPKMTFRRFVLDPLKEIAPGIKHPVLFLDTEALYARCNDRSYCNKLPQVPMYRTTE
ncbi:MAG: 2-amino-4-hydroxy-6-hydroxymethyldihydropteridine diphosphokinase [Bacteroidales bacterium]|nr:2-amino-4-hydroxy-6-hydroxymethyldihydropteridine diphosphokinase [Bacteroidales bacterium]